MSRRDVTALLAAALLCAGCGASATGGAGGSFGGAKSSSSHTRSAPGAPHAHPRAIEPVAGAAAAGSIRVPKVASVSVSSPGQAASLPEPESIVDVRRQLAASGMTAHPDQATLTANLLAVAPIGAPAAVQEVLAAGNQIAHLPYIWGGGHQTYEDTGYDCSGSLSYVLAAAGLLDQTRTSGELEHWGRPGPGRWITVFANAGHTFMYVAGMRFDTVALAETGSRWSNRSADESNLASFVERHPAGL